MGISSWSLRTGLCGVTGINLRNALRSHSQPTCTRRGHLATRSCKPHADGISQDQRSEFCNKQNLGRLYICKHQVFPYIHQLCSQGQSSALGLGLKLRATECKLMSSSKAGAIHLSTASTTLSSTKFWNKIRTREKHRNLNGTSYQLSESPWTGALRAPDNG